MATERFPDWPERLVHYLQEATKKPFDWGQHDCVLFALGAAKATTGVATVDELRGKYKSAIGAQHEMRRRYGASNLTEAATAVQKEWGVDEIPILMAQRGDIVEADVIFAEGDSGPSLGVVDLDGSHALFAGPSGAIRIKIIDCRRAWRIG